MKIPKIEKVVLNMGLGLEGNDNKIIKVIEKDMSNITGQNLSLRCLRSPYLILKQE